MNIDLEERKRRERLLVLNQLQGDINNLKLGLSKVLSREFSAALLERMEGFQTQLLNHDAAIAVLRHELSHKGIDAFQCGRMENNFSPDSNSGRGIRLMSDDVERLKTQLGKYTAAFNGLNIF